MVVMMAMPVLPILSVNKGPQVQLVFQLASVQAWKKSLSWQGRSIGTAPSKWNYKTSIASAMMERCGSVKMSRKRASHISWISTVMRMLGHLLFHYLMLVQVTEPYYSNCAKKEYTLASKTYA